MLYAMRSSTVVINVGSFAGPATKRTRTVASWKSIMVSVRLDAVGHIIPAAIHAQRSATEIRNVHFVWNSVRFSAVTRNATRNVMSPVCLARNPVLGLVRIVGLASFHVRYLVTYCPVPSAAR